MRTHPFEVIVTPMHECVTGSCFHVKVQFARNKDYTFIVDCGLFQGKDEYQLNQKPFPRYMKAAGRIFLTHNHVDHTGRVPELVRAGFKGQIHCSPQTASMLGFSWADCAKIAKTNARLENTEPRFKMRHVTKSLRKVVPYGFYNRKELHPGVWATFYPNAHTLGAAMLLIEVENPKEGGDPINILFSGDYNSENPFFEIREIPEEVRQMPLHLICESTYGALKPPYIREKVFEDNIYRESRLWRQILIPVFAFERGQHILVKLRKMQDSGRLNIGIPIFIDGILLRRYNKIYIANAENYFKEDMQSIIPCNCHEITKKIQRQELLMRSEPYILVSTSGMASYGPVSNYLKSFVQNPNGVIHFAGYQCEGTMGWKLKKANEEGSLVEVNGNLMNVKCRVYYTSEFSSHAMPPQLLDFICKFDNLVSVSLNHGSEEAKTQLAEMVLETGVVNEVGNMTCGRQFHFSPDRMENVELIQKTLY